MAMSTMDNASAQLAIALQLHDLDEMEALGTVEKFIIRLQRQQLEIDSGFDALQFEASRRLALSMAKAIESDSSLLAQSTSTPQIDDATFDRLVQLNQPHTTSSETLESIPQGKSTRGSLHSNAEGKKRARSVTPEDGSSTTLVNSKRAELHCHSHTAIDHARHIHKKAKGEQKIIEQNQRNQDGMNGVCSMQDPQSSTADAGSAEMMEETKPTSAEATSLSTAECASCSEILTSDKLVKVSCEHYYCKDCFGQYIEASLQTHDGFPPKCCKFPIAFITVADNVSPALFERYRTRQAEIKNATALYCSIQKCGVKIEKGRIDGFRATCVACWRDTCTRCCGTFPPKINGENVGHTCKEDKAREQVLELATEEGWQNCYQCGNLVALNYGCHHMTCRCQAEFCYRCGAKWKNCTCGDYDEPRLELRAARGIRLRAARRDELHLPRDPRPHEEQLAELQQRLRVDCDHNNFIYEGGKTPVDPGYCEICEYQGWKYIFRCSRCGFTACKYCHNYRGWKEIEDDWGDNIFDRRQYDDDTDDDTDDEHVSEDESI